jgi:anaerobic selenocysteine-containing dehydrogenase
MSEEILTFCPLCAGHCAARATVEDGKIVKWERDRESGIPSGMCPTLKGRSNMEISRHPARLKFPQKRIGARGEGKWQRISWEEALDDIAQKLIDIKEQHGPEAFGVGLGEPKGLEFAFGQRLASAFETPNVATPSHLCAASKMAASLYTFGPGVPYGHADMENLPGLITVWGANIVQTEGPHSREWLSAALAKGARLIVVDPKKIEIAGRADLWVRPRPGSDGALALGLIKVVIDEQLYDKDFVLNHTLGFDKLEREIGSFTLDDVTRVTWVPVEQIQEFARMIAREKPAFMRMGNVFSHGVNSLQAARAICILSAITGPENIPGWDLAFKAAKWTRPGRLMLLSSFPRQAESSLGGKYKWAMMTAYIPYQALTRGMLDDKVKAAFFILSNPLSSYPNAHETHDALNKLDLLFVSELFMTPTAAMADYVLPAATSGEHDTMGYWGGPLRAFPKLVDPPGESWSDVRIVIELAKRLGLGEHFPASEKDAVDLVLEPSGLSWEDFKEKRLLSSIKGAKDPEASRVRTPSGKIEIYSEQLTEFDSNPMPRWQELSRFHSGDLSEEFPLILTTRLEDAYKLTGFKHLESGKKRKPEPTLEMNPGTAESLGLKDGDWVEIETVNGRIRQKLDLDNELDPKVVYASFGWWFPEESNNLYEWDRSNVNVLFDTSLEEPATGTVEVRGIPCRVSGPAK